MYFFRYSPEEKKAKNPKTPVSVLEQLAKDEDELVRRNVAENPNASVSALEQLAQIKENK